MSKKLIVAVVAVGAIGWLQWASADKADKPCTEPSACAVSVKAECCPSSTAVSTGCPSSQAVSTGCPSSQAVSTGCPSSAAVSTGCPGSSVSAGGCPGSSTVAAECPHATAGSCPQGGCDECPVAKVSSCPHADSDECPVAKAKCPISGKPADKEQSVEYKGGKVYLCCGGCPQPFKKNTAKFAAKANHQLVVTGQARLVRCPLTGRPLDPDTVLEVSGVDVAFCCNGCKGKASKAEGDEQIALVFNDEAFTKGFEAKKSEPAKVH